MSTDTVRKAADDLKALRSTTTLPLCSDYLYQAVRHVQRNCEIECPEHGDNGVGDETAECNEPTRYDGNLIAALVNAVPDLLAEIGRLKEQAAKDLHALAVVLRLTYEFGDGQDPVHVERIADAMCAAIARRSPPQSSPPVPAVSSLDTQ